jgi:hypothetical protein
MKLWQRGRVTPARLGVARGGESPRHAVASTETSQSSACGIHNATATRTTAAPVITEPLPRTRSPVPLVAHPKCHSNDSPIGRGQQRRVELTKQ